MSDNDPFLHLIVISLVMAGAGQTMPSLRGGPGLVAAMCVSRVLDEVAYALLHSPGRL
jgi:hypothetical protein